MQHIKSTQVLYICNLFGDNFNLVVWQFFGFLANFIMPLWFHSYYIYKAAAAFCQIKVTPTTITK